ncbi:MAG: CaiB/BaiF CoA-transferase family protein [Anaerolineae bacterium]
MALEGIRVLDLTRLLPGAMTTLLLVDLGAQVIKVEDPNGGDYVRWSQPQIDQLSVFFRMNNRGKRSIILDLKQEDGQAVLKKLVEQSDILIESFRPSVMARLGCDYEALKAVNPRLIYCALSGWGADGPYAPNANHDLNYVSVAGLPGAMEDPQVMGGQVADMGGAYVALAGILAALFRRERTGQGAFVDTSLSESALPFSLYNWTEALTLGLPPGKGMLSGGMACYRIYRAKDDKPVALAALEEKFWLNFCHAVDRPDLVEDHTDFSRQDYLIAELRGIFSLKTAAEWDALLARADCCFTLVNAPGDIGDDLHYKARGMLGRFPDGTPWMRSPVRLNDQTPNIENSVPAYGAHTWQVLLEAGYSKDEVELLIVRGIAR